MTTNAIVEQIQAVNAEIQGLLRKGGALGSRRAELIEKVHNNKVSTREFLDKSRELTAEENGVLHELQTKYRAVHQG